MNRAESKFEGPYTIVGNYFIKNANNSIHYETIVRGKLKIIPNAGKTKSKINSIWQHPRKSEIPEYFVTDNGSHNILQ